MYSNSFSQTSEGGQEKRFKVNGNGYLFASASVRCDGTVSYGTVQTNIKKNDEYVAYSSNRLENNNGAAIGSNSCGFIQVMDEDIISINLYGSKGGTKIMYYHFLCFGCNVEEIA